MKLWKIILISLALYGCEKEGFAQEPQKELRAEVIIENPVFKVWYSEIKEQPLKLIYTSTNRVKNVDRGSMNFYTEKEVHTSDNADYYRNVWDKGHLAPAATYSDSYENLRQTFSYLNCALQQEKLNRGTWKHLEEFERGLTQFGDVRVTIEVDFPEQLERVPAGAAIPSGFYKQIMVGDSMWCYWFPNKVPTSSDFRDYECDCR